MHSAGAAYPKIKKYSRAHSERNGILRGRGGHAHTGCERVHHRVTVPLLEDLPETHVGADPAAARSSQGRGARGCVCGGFEEALVFQGFDEFANFDSDPS